MLSRLESARTIADQHLHAAIRAREVIPAFPQVDFRAELDLLLAEIVRKLEAVGAPDARGGGELLPGRKVSATVKNRGTSWLPEGGVTEASARSGWRLRSGWRPR